MRCTECCKEMKFKVEDPDHAYWAELHGVRVVDGYAVFPIKCTKLTKDGCSIYENRPGMCQRFYCNKPICKEEE